MLSLLLVFESSFSIVLLLLRERCRSDPVRSWQALPLVSPLGLISFKQPLYLVQSLYMLHLKPYSSFIAPWRDRVYSPHCTGTIPAYYRELFDVLCPGKENKVETRVWRACMKSATLPDTVLQQVS